MIKIHVMHTGAKKFLVSAPELDDTKKFPAAANSCCFFSDGGYAEKSWREEIPPGTALDEAQALNSLRWIAKISRSPECVESLANHDTGVVPHEIVI